MKLQACKFRRTSTVKKENTVFKSNVTWETGVAVVLNFNSDVEYILDEAGKKVSQKEMYAWKLNNNLGFSAIDIKFEGE